MRIICISGKAEAGKTTTAYYLKDELKNQGVTRVLHTNYAGVLKFVCKAFFCWDGEKNEKGRALLQRIGTDVVRKQNPNFWVNFMKDILLMFPEEWDYVLIDDVRFINEIETMKEAFDNVITLRIERPNYENHLTPEQRLHKSECELDDYNFDYVINNPGNSDIRKVVSDLLNEIGE